jgi:hypothetical protein
MQSEKEGYKALSNRLFGLTCMYTQGSAQCSLRLGFEKAQTRVLNLKACIYKGGVKGPCPTGSQAGLHVHTGQCAIYTLRSIDQQGSMILSGVPKGQQTSFKQICMHGGEEGPSRLWG